MDKLKEQVRRGTQKVLQSVGMADKTVDDTFDNIEAENKAVVALSKDVEKDIAAIISSMTTLSNSAASLAVHMQQSEKLLSSGLMKSPQSPLNPEGDAGENAQEIGMLKEALEHFYNAQKLVTRKIVSAALLDMKQNAYGPLAHEDGVDPLAQRVSQAVERRNSALLDYDALRRRSQNSFQLNSARQELMEVSQEAENVVRSATIERSAAIVNSFSVVLRSLIKFYGDANTVMNPVAKEVKPLGAVVNAYTHPHQSRPAAPAPAAAAPAKPQPQQQQPKQQSSSTLFDIPSSQSPAATRNGPVTSGSVFDILEGTPNEEPASAPAPAAAAAPSPAASNSLLDINFGPSSSTPNLGSSQSKSALDDFFGGSPTPSVTPPSSSTPSAADAFSDFGSPLQPQQSASSTMASSSSVDVLFGAAPISTGSSSSFSVFGDSGSQSNTVQQAPTLSEDDSNEILPTKEDVHRWSTSGGRVANLRALLSSMHTVLWPGSGWKPVSLADLVDVQQVKDVYKRAFLIVHPDKVVGPRRQELARQIFSALRAAYDMFKKEIAQQQAALAAAVPKVNPHAGDVD